MNIVVPIKQVPDLVEELAHCYWGTLCIGGPQLLDNTQMEAVQQAFVTYGQQKPS